MPSLVLQNLAAQNPGVQNLAQGFTERMLNGVLESAALAVVACLLMKALGRKSSGTRFAVWFVVLLSTIALPLMEFPRHSSPVAEQAPAAILIPGSWAIYLFSIWGVIAAGFLSRVALGLGQIRSLRQNCTLLDTASMDPALQSVVTAFCGRPVAFYVSEILRVPMATGFFRPMIVIPSWALRELSLEDLKGVLFHEAAHLRRWDDWTNLAQKVLRAVFFFHPVVWWVESKLALEREMACDDMVVAATSSPRAYAACLIAVAEKNLGRRGLALAQAAVHRMRHTSLRIRGILDRNRPIGVKVWKPAVGMTLASAVVCMASMQAVPKLIGFRSSASEPDAVASTTTPVPSLDADANLYLKKAKLSLPATRARAKSNSKPAPRIAPEVETAAVPPEVVAEESDNAIAPDQVARVVPASAQLQNSPTSQTFGFATTETVFVVTQDPQVSAAGNQMFRISVYRWTVFYPSVYFENTRKPLSKSI